MSRYNRRKFCAAAAANEYDDLPAALKEWNSSPGATVTLSQSITSHCINSPMTDFVWEKNNHTERISYPPVLT